MAKTPSSPSPATDKTLAKRKRVGAALAFPFRKLSSRLRPSRPSAAASSAAPTKFPEPERPADPPAA